MTVQELIGEIKEEGAGMRDTLILLAGYILGVSVTITAHAFFHKNGSRGNHG